MASDVIDHIVRFNASTNGRDKLCRVFQYGSKFGWWYCQVNHKDEEMVHKLKILETALSATRKVLRFGKSFDMIQGALLGLTLSDNIHKYTIFLSKTNQAFYLLIDHLIWMGKTGLVRVDTKKYANLAAKFWLATLVFHLTRNVYDIISAIGAKIQGKPKQKDQIMYRKSNGEVSWGKNNQERNMLVECIMENKPIFFDTVRNLADLTLPLASLGYWDTPAGFQGIMGMISSMIGMATVWNIKLRLVP